MTTRSRFPGFIKILSGFVLFSNIEFSLANTNAQNVEDVALKSIWAASSSDELINKVKNLTQLQKFRLQCRSQLKSERIPSRCFEVIEIENKAGLIQDSTSQSQIKWLTNVCRNRAKKSSNWQELAEAKGASHLPTACLNDANQRLSDLKYQAESENPDLLFEFRLKPQSEAAVQ